MKSFDKDSIYCTVTYITALLVKLSLLNGFQMDKLTCQDRLPAYMTNIVMMLLMVRSCFLLSFLLLASSGLSPLLLPTVSLSDWGHICHRVWCDSLPHLHEGCPSHEFQPYYPEPRAADSKDHGSHHQPGGYPHTG